MPGELMSILDSNLNEKFVVIRIRQKFLHGNRITPTETCNYNGVIARVSDDVGVAYIFAKTLNRHYIFSYNKISGYAGESTKEMQLKSGKQVNFSLKDGIVQSVELL